MYQGRNPYWPNLIMQMGAKIQISFIFYVARIIMKEENVVNWQPYWANLIMQNGCENVNLWNLQVFICLSLDLLQKSCNFGKQLGNHIG
jgi:hypothetical protein